jgi:hypothetical protein
MPEEGPLMVVVITLLKVIVCPPDATLTITIVVPDNIAEPSTVESESEDVVSSDVLVNWLDDTTGLGARAVV